MSYFKRPETGEKHIVSLYYDDKNKCEISEWDDGYIEIKDDNFEYTICMKDNSLDQLKPLNKKGRVSVVIPHIFPTGHRIDSLGNSFLVGHYDEVHISNGIKVEGLAFNLSDVNSVFWPDDCDEIPDSCFCSSKIKQIFNIENVKTIGDAAFIYSNIREITWPSSCEEIPSECFLLSKLRMIHNLSHVKKIGRIAFSRTKIKYLDFDHETILHLEVGSLFGLSKPIGASPRYISSEEWDRAFLLE